MYHNIIIPYFEEYLKTLNNNQTSDIIKYSLEGGKCIRGFIVKHIIETYTTENVFIWEPIVCIELIHCASLIIDDLPCMDNDKYRRGKLSTFSKYGERSSILTSLFIMAESFKILFNGFSKIQQQFEKYNLDYDQTYFDPKKQLNLVQNLINDWCELIGKNLIVGQMLDLKEDISKILDISFEDINDNKAIIIFKTSSLFMLSFVIGAIFSGKNDLNIEEFKEMGYHFGIMFQLMDDYKDIKKDEGKTNFILDNGFDKAKISFYNSKNKLIELLQKNKLYTNDFKILINKLIINFDNNNDIQINI